MLTISAISAFNDNYVWCLTDSRSRKALVVDPGQAEPVLDYLSHNDLTLDTILITHHHADHVGGVAVLRKAFPECQVTGPANSPFRDSDRKVRSGDEVIWQDISFRVIEVPGHTLDHVAYYTETEIDGQPVLFCGDTLFVSGCGRVFEGTPEQMRESLRRLRDLPDNTAVYCAHEYTLANLRFARSVLPDDQALADFEILCLNRRNAGQPTVPSTIGQEKQLNPFLRWDDPAVIQATCGPGSGNRSTENQADAVFTALRQAKDRF